MSKMDLRTDTDLAEVAALIAKGDTVVFVGAGLSVGAGLPGWSALIRPLAESVGASLPPDQYLTAEALLKAAQTYVNKRGRLALVQYLREKLDPQGLEPQ